MCRFRLSAEIVNNGNVKQFSLDHNFWCCGRLRMKVWLIKSQITFSTQWICFYSLLDLLNGPFDGFLEFSLGGRGGSRPRAWINGAAKEPRGPRYLRRHPQEVPLAYLPCECMYFHGTCVRIPRLSIAHILHPHARLSVFPTVLCLLNFVYVNVLGRWCILPLMLALDDAVPLLTV